MSKVPSIRVKSRGEGNSKAGHERKVHQQTKPVYSFVFCLPRLTDAHEQGYRQRKPSRDVDILF